MTPNLLRQLEAVDWDFPRINSEATGAFHWYPGTFPPQLPGTLIEALTREGELVFDPYGGIGTTVVEALRLGRKAWHVDQCPIGYLTAYVTSGLILSKAVDPTMYISTIAAVERIFGGKTFENDLFSFANESAIDSVMDHLMRPAPQEVFAEMRATLPSKWSLLAPWYEPNTLQEIKKLFGKILNSELSSLGKLFGLVMLSATLRIASSQNRSWGHVADNVLPDEFTIKNVGELCRRWLSRVGGMLNRSQVCPLSAKHRRAVQFWASCHDWRSDSALKVGPKSKINALITSPPYANAIDYTRAQRLSLYLFGFNEKAITTMGHSEIGARRKRSNSLSESIWAAELASALEKQVSFLADDGSVSIVLPHEDHGREAGAIHMGETLNTLGWVNIFKKDRSIRQGRTRQCWTSIKRETIEIYQHEK
ncbi:MAG: site-specific DNA-methyltransferase [Verrucomicrobiota bacterium]|nr:site-specific DNA-methyltransferase [Verrucomicrobiota bacterium]